MKSLRFGLFWGLLAATGCGRSAPFGPVQEAASEAGAPNVTGGGAAGTSVAGTPNVTGGGAAGTSVAGSGGSSTTGAGGSTVGGSGGSGTTDGGTSGGGSAGQMGTAPDGVPSLRVPRNGASTGSVFAMRSLTPVFAWTPVGGASAYEIEIDDSCPASEFDGCAFPSPERRALVSDVRYAVLEALPVSRVAPVGTRYFWRVRACSGACGAWSSVRYVDVGRQRQDLDGDGYADTWLLRPTDLLGSSTLDVFFGPPPFARSVALRVGPEVGGSMDNFGHSADAVGDVNLDGYSDLAVGAPRASTEAELASVFLFFGGPELSQGALAYVGWHSPSLLGFGNSVVALGDVDADGAQDFAAGGHWGTPQPLSLFLGGTTIPAPRHEISSTSSELSLTPISGGDLDADGYSDLLTLEADPLGNQRFAGLLGADQLPEFERLSGGALQIGTDERAATVGDTNGDGFVERVAFTLGFDDAPPAIDVIFGSLDRSAERSRWDTGVTEDEDVGVWPSVWNVVNAGDVNGDGLDDTAVEIRLDYSALVDVALFFGGGGARERADLVYRIEGSEKLYVSGGTARAVGDTDGDGFDDLVIVSNWDKSARLFLGGAMPDGAVDQVIGAMNP